MSLFKFLKRARANIFAMNPLEVQETVEKTGQAASYIAVNKTEAIQGLTNGIIDSGKGVVTIHIGGKAGISVFKGVKDYFRGDVIRTGL
jgi:hypothetical protein